LRVGRENLGAGGSDSKALKRKKRGWEVWMLGKDSMDGPRETIFSLGIFALVPRIGSLSRLRNMRVNRPTCSGSLKISSS
jgi:hypothetical protein